jgi:hypothetical protein
MLLVGSREKFADPDDLLEALVFADLKDDLLGVRELVGRESVTPVYKERDIGMPGSKGRGRNLVNRAPRKPKGSRLVECSGGKIHYASNGD